MQFVQNTQKAFRYLLGFVMCFAGVAHAGNLYDPGGGDLKIPVLQVGSKAYNATFTRLSTSPLRWGSSTFSPVSPEARTAASYNNSTKALTLPEVNVNGKLYNLTLNRYTEGCDFVACIEADVSSLVALGREGGVIFTKPISSASTYSCSSCHAMSETNSLAADGLRRPGHSLMDAPNRASFKNGQIDNLLDAVNTCVTEWMNATAWTETDKNWINLNNWLSDQATNTEPELVTISIKEAPAELSGGDIDNGRTVFNKTCTVCHGDNGVGTEQAPKITETGLQPDYIARRIRTSGLSNSSTYPGLTGGIMPFWGEDRLSDSELLDLVAYVSEGSAEVLDMGGDSGSSTSGCTSDHPNVGQEAILTQRFHGVSGKATIVDDCTIRLTEFNFDGGGIVVAVYLGQNGNYNPSAGAFSTSGDLVGTAFSNATLTLTLPTNKSLDDFNSISIWCVGVGISFGDGVFAVAES